MCIGKEIVLLNIMHQKGIQHILVSSITYLYSEHIISSANKRPISPNGHLSTCAITYTQILKQPPVPIPRGRQKLSFCANR